MSLYNLVDFGLMIIAEYAIFRMSIDIDISGACILLILYYRTLRHAIVIL